MLNPEIPVTREGYPFIGYSAFLTILAAILGYPLITLFLLILTTFVLMFFRDPERFIPDEEGAVVSPADGKVIVSEIVTDDRFADTPVWKISIFMNVFNVHVNRNPASGKVEKVKYVPGQFISADNAKAHLKNEYCAVTMITDSGHTLTYVQIAGLIARRIVCWIVPGEIINRGERFGLIRFGSRLDVYLPADSEIRVNVGQKVRAGETVLAIFT